MKPCPFVPVENRQGRLRGTQDVAPRFPHPRFKPQQSCDCHVSALRMELSFGNWVLVPDPGQLQRARVNATMTVP